MSFDEFGDLIVGICEHADTATELAIVRLDPGRSVTQATSGHT